MTAESWARWRIKFYHAFALTLLPVARSAGPAADPAIVALLIAVAAWRRRESCGAHFRIDFPASDLASQRRFTLTLEAALLAARDIAASDIREVLDGTL